MTRRGEGAALAAAVAPVDLTPAIPAARTLTAADLDGVVEELAAYHAHFAPLFRRPEQRGWAVLYLRGLLTADVPRKNVEALALRLLGAGPGADRTVRALQQFVGEGGWSRRRWRKPVSCSGAGNAAPWNVAR